ncbi:MAG TPA: hypothetical protein VKT28_10245 [Puia sp.]|nr:hypothetical protein [Puia sp.]
MQINTSQGSLITVEVREIKLRKFSLNELGYIPGADRRVKIEIAQNIGFNLEFQLANLVLTAFFFYEDTPAVQLAQIEVENVFFIKELTSFMVDAESIKLPLEFYVIIFTEAIPQTRALFSQSLKGTVFNNVLIQLTNPIAMVSYYFPNLRDELEKRFPDSLSPVSTETL